MAEIDKKSLEYLAELARLELSEEQGKKFLEDLGKILDYFKQLQEIDTIGIEPMTGGTELRSVTRKDIVGRTDDTGKGKSEFPENEKGYLKVPPVF